MEKERLIRIISNKGHLAVDLRQLDKRLRTLLPARLDTIKKRYQESGRTSKKAELMALTDAEYLSHLDEMIRIAASARENRVQYETYLMLYKARQSLNSFNKASKTGRK